MKNRTAIVLNRIILFIILFFCGNIIFAQSTMTTGNPGQPTTLSNTPQRDTNANKTNNNKWHDEEARIHFIKLNSSAVYNPDTSLHTFHRRPFSQPWYQDQGNLGSPTLNLLFTPEDRLGPTLGYHIFDVYRFNIDSLNYYNTTRPYSMFSYQLGSKLEQMAGIMVTENIKPNWNFSFDYRKINSPGFYRIQRNNDDNGNLTTNYQSPNKHYELYGAMTYNKEQHDENGGILRASQLDSSEYGDRRTLDVGYENDAYSTIRSTVTNIQRDFTVLLQHSYTWGIADTTYNADSTKFTARLIPRFRLTHRLALSTEKHEFKDIGPDSLRYTGLFQQSFANDGTIGTDSVFTRQQWFWVDNQFLLNGFIGKDLQQLEFSAGLGNRVDQFATYYVTGTDHDNFISNYAVGEIKKEALRPGQWHYQANGKLFLTGDDAGDFQLNASLGRTLKGDLGNFTAGFSQSLNDAPYSYRIYENQYYKLTADFNKESVTQLYGSLESSRLRLSAGVRNYTIDNYIYINELQVPAQYATPFNLTQIWVRKIFRFGTKVFFDNELAYQQQTANAPVNVPALMGRHQLSYETDLFKSALRVAVGIDVRYNTAYYAAGYDPLLSRFYYQHTTLVSNFPQTSAFFNFRIKRFRAFVMGDQLQAAIARNYITYPGYPAQDPVIRFGFTWVLIN